jgi:hypothetical protein
MWRFGLLVCILALATALPITTARAQPADDPKAACEAKGHRWNPETGLCTKSLRPHRKGLPSSGGAGGGDCHPGYTYDARYGGCVLYQDGRVIFF